MKSVQMKRRKRREKGQISIRSLICAAVGAVSIIILAAGIISSVSEKGSRMMAGVSMLFFFVSLCALFFGIKAAKREGFTPGSKFWGVFLPTAAFVGYAILYIIGLLNIL